MALCGNWGQRNSFVGRGEELRERRRQGEREGRRECRRKERIVGGREAGRKRGRGEGHSWHCMRTTTELHTTSSSFASPR